MRTDTSRPPKPSTDVLGDGAVVVHAYNFLNPNDCEKFRVARNLTLADVAPKTTLPVVCCVNGDYVLKADWEVVELEDYDVCTFLTLPQGGGGNGNSLMSVVGLVMLVVGIFTYNPYLIAAGAGLLVGGLMPMPETVPIGAPPQVQAASPTYSLNLSGNTARLGQTIPVLYGRHLITPDFAANPYTEYSGADDQYYNALLCFGLGDDMVVESVMIDDTVIEHFTDIQSQLIGPSFEPALTLIDPAVVTAPEVASQELLAGTYVGPFASNGAGLKTYKIGVDIICPKGLYYADDDGELQAKTVQWMVEARKISDAGASIGNWFVLGIESLNLSQNSPVRRSYTYNVAAARYEIRVQRLDVKDTNARAAHELTWAGLRSYIQVTTPLEANANYYAVRIKATNQLSGLSQRRFTMIIRRKLPRLIETLAWTAPVETQSIASALGDVLRNPVYGGGVPDSRIDLQSLYDLDQIWTARGDRFNGIFDSRITMWDALTQIARCGRARPIMRGNVFTFVRDQAQSLPTGVFSMRNVKRGSFEITYKVPTEDDPDGIELEYFNAKTWSSDYVTMPLPGIVGDPVKPMKFSMKGITGLKQAQREAAYWAADAVYRPVAVNYEAELEGFLPAYGDLVAVSHDLASWGISGELISFDGMDYVSSEELVWTGATHYALLTDEFGDPHGPYQVSAGEAPNSLRFAEAIAVTPYFGTERERTKFVMGPATSYAKMCVVKSIAPSGENSVSMQVIVDDQRVHDADLPYAGDDGDGGGGGGGGGGEGRVARYAPAGTPVYDSASDTQRNSYGFFTREDVTVGTENDEGYVYTRRVDF